MLMNVFNLVTSDFDIIIKAATAAGGLYLFFRGIIEYRNNNRTKQAEFLEKLIAGFDSPKMEIAIRILDDYDCTDLDPEGDCEKQGATDLVTILRDHRKVPVTDKTQIKIRDSFCNLLDYFSKLNYYLKNDLISKDEIGYFRYYIDKVEDNEAIINYISFYYFESDFEKLFKEINPAKAVNLRRAFKTKE